MGKSPIPTGQETRPGRARLPSLTGQQRARVGRPNTGVHDDVRAESLTRTSDNLSPAAVASHLPQATGHTRVGPRSPAGAGTWTTTARPTSPTSPVVASQLSGRCPGGGRHAVVVRGGGAARSPGRAPPRACRCTTPTRWSSNGSGAAHRNRRPDQPTGRFLVDGGAVDERITAAKRGCTRSESRLRASRTPGPMARWSRTAQTIGACRVRFSSAHEAQTPREQEMSRRCRTRPGHRLPRRGADPRKVFSCCVHVPLSPSPSR